MHKLAHHQSHCPSYASIFPCLTMDSLQLTQTANPSPPTGSGLTVSAQSYIAASRGCISTVFLPLIHSLIQGWQMGKHQFSIFSHFQLTLGLYESCQREFSFQMQSWTDKEGGASARVHRSDTGSTLVPSAWDCLMAPFKQHPCAAFHEKGQLIAFLITARWLGRIMWSTDRICLSFLCIKVYIILFSGSF